MSTESRLRQLGTAAVSDALDSLGIDGGILGVGCRVPGASMVGPAYTVRYAPLGERDGNFRQAGNYIDEVPPGAVIVIDNGGRADATTWGNILTEVAMHRGIAGTVVYGSARDAARIRELGYPLFSCHVFMQSAKNRAVLVARQETVAIGGRFITPGDLIAADDDGCVVVPKAVIGEVLDRAERTVATEELILAAVRVGEPLAAARQRFGYAAPWQGRS